MSPALLREAGAARRERTIEFCRELVRLPSFSGEEREAAELTAEEMRRLIREVGRTPVQRSTLYEVVQRFDDPAEDPPSLEPQEPVELSGPTRWRLAQERGARRVASGY